VLSLLRPAWLRHLGACHVGLDIVEGKVTEGV
jgi:hypothetical protein